MIDWGNAGTLTSEQQTAFLKLMKATQKQDAELFVSTMGGLMSRDSSTQLERQRAELERETARILSQPGKTSNQVICQVMDRFNDYDLEVPAVISNFSRSAQMLENQMKRLDRIYDSLEQRGGTVKRYTFQDAVRGIGGIPIRKMAQLV